MSARDGDRAADHDMHDDLALPPYYLITPEPAAGSDAALAAILDRLSDALAPGHTLVQLRGNTLDAFS